MINFAKYATKQCECSHGVNQFICTSKNCKKSPLVCSDCFFDEHHDHSNFCIPINRYKMQQLAPKFYETIVNYSKTLTTMVLLISGLCLDVIVIVVDPCFNPLITPAVDTLTIVGSSTV